MASSSLYESGLKKRLCSRAGALIRPMWPESGRAGRPPSAKNETSAARLLPAEQRRSKKPKFETVGNLAASETHLFEDGAAQEAVGRRQSLQHFEVVIAFTHQQGDRFAGGFQRGVHGARLALKFRSFKGAVRDDHGTVEAVEVTLRRQLLLNVVGEPDVF